MPIIDVSQKSYRALVIAAHKRGMSVDRFIQHSIEKELDNSEDQVPTETASPPVADQPLAFTPPPPRPRRADPRPATKQEPPTPFDAVWRRIEESAGHAISTKRGQDFTYEVEAGYLTVVESGARIPRSQFKKALGQWPQNGPSNMRGIYAASFVWAVLADERIIDNAA